MTGGSLIEGRKMESRRATRFLPVNNVRWLLVAAASTLLYCRAGSGGQQGPVIAPPPPVDAGGGQSDAGSELTDGGLMDAGTDPGAMCPNELGDNGMCLCRADFEILYPTSDTVVTCREDVSPSHPGVQVWPRGRNDGGVFAFGPFTTFAGSAVVTRSTPPPYGPPSVQTGRLYISAGDVAPCVHAVDIVVEVCDDAGAPR